MKILGIETSSSIFSLCLCDDARLLYEVRKDRESGAGVRDAGIFKEASSLLAALPDRRPDAVAVSIGPGMFTSLRVGLSLAKGICYAHGVGLVGINTLDCIGAESVACDGIMCAVINAHRGEIYAAFYRRGQRIGDLLLTTPRELSALIGKGKKQRVVIGGPGTDILKGSGIAFNTPHSRLLPSGIIFLSASRIVSLAMDRIKKRQYDAIEYLEPCYLKKTDAERNPRFSAEILRRRI